MSKCYVIKNKEGKYLVYVDNYGFGFDKSIVCSHIFVKREGAEEEKDFILRNKYKFHIDDLDIVPITICEGDIEEENRVLKAKLETAEYWNRKYDGLLERVNDIKKAFRNLIEEYLTTMNYINGDSLKVTKKEIDEDFNDRIKQAKESEKDGV